MKPRTASQSSEIYSKGEAQKPKIWNKEQKHVPVSQHVQQKNFSTTAINCHY